MFLNLHHNGIDTIGFSYVQLVVNVFKDIIWREVEEGPRVRDRAMILSDSDLINIHFVRPVLVASSLTMNPGPTGMDFLGSKMAKVKFF